MHSKLLTWACLLFACHGRRLQKSERSCVPAESSQSLGRGGGSGLNALNRFLLAPKLAAGFKFCHPMVHSLSGRCSAHRLPVIRLRMSEKPLPGTVTDSSITTAQGASTGKQLPDIKVVAELGDSENQVATSIKPSTSMIAQSKTSSTSEAGFATEDDLMAVVALNVVTIIWGSQHAVIKDLVEACPPAAVNAVRFTFAALLAAPFLPGAPWNRATSPVPPTSTKLDGITVAAEQRELPESAIADDPQSIWFSGLELGVWMFAGFALQAFGLQFTTASRSAFLLYLNVKLVPLLNLLFYGRQSDAKTWLSAFIAFSGTALLSFDGAPPNVGDAFSLAAAATSAMFILRLESASQAHDSAQLNAATLACSAGLCLAWALADLTLIEPDRASTVAGSLADLAPQFAYLSIIVTALANYLQTVGQAGVRAQDAAIIYSLDPVYGAFFSWLLLGETLGRKGFAGGALVLSAVALSRSDLLEDVSEPSEIADTNGSVDSDGL